MKATLVVTTVAALLALSACGNDPGTRAITGGAIGVGAPLIAGAAVGAVAGAVTTPGQDERAERREERREERRDREDRRDGY